jgi:dTDP-4-amino-4,6-dideoxygalactose transaminase
MIPAFVTEFSDDEIAEILGETEAILRSGRLILGRCTAEFEAAAAQMAGTRFAVAVNSGSTALEIIFRSLNVCGRRVLVPTNTNFATAASALHAGASVTLYDSGLSPNLDDLARRITPGVAAVVVVHVGGYISPGLPEIARLCADHSVALIEDAAHAHGSTLHRRPAGSFGYAAAFSFYPTKVVTTGEGGVIATNDQRLDEVARRYRDQGKTSDGQWHVAMGNSWRLTEAGAAIGVARLKRLTDDVRRRQNIINRYVAELACSRLSFPTLAPGSHVSGYKCVAMLEPGISRSAMRVRLSERGVNLAREVYAAPLHRQPVFADLNVHDTFAAADDFAERHVCLPVWRGMDVPAIQQVVDAVTAALAEGHS